MRIERRGNDEKSLHLHYLLILPKWVRFDDKLFAHEGVLDLKQKALEDHESKRGLQAKQSEVLEDLKLEGSRRGRSFRFLDVFLRNLTCS